MEYPALLPVVTRGKNDKNKSTQEAPGLLHRSLCLNQTGLDRQIFGDVWMHAKYNQSISVLARDCYPVESNWSDSFWIFRSSCAYYIRVQQALSLVS